MKVWESVSMLVIAVSMSGCIWRTNEEERQIPARSYLRPIGETAGTTITLEGKQRYSFTIDKNRGEHGKRYGIEPDSYRVTVRRGGKVVVSRVLFIADGETRDLPIR